MVTKRQLGPFTVNPIGLGCMSLSHAYGIPPSPEEGLAMLRASLDWLTKGTVEGQGQGTVRLGY